uniref:Uncharacterized protein n=1 Tax=Oryza barthii TaxID=65489 RepID=A0A0D3GRC8_9ORYZ
MWGPQYGLPPAASTLDGLGLWSEVDHLTRPRSGLRCEPREAWLPSDPSLGRRSKLRVGFVVLSKISTRKKYFQVLI